MRDFHSTNARNPQSRPHVNRMLVCSPRTAACELPLPAKSLTLGGQCNRHQECQYGQHCTEVGCALGLPK